MSAVSRLIAIRISWRVDDSAVGVDVNRPYPVAGADDHREIAAPGRVGGDRRHEARRYERADKNRTRKNPDPPTLNGHDAPL